MTTERLLRAALPSLALLCIASPAFAANFSFTWADLDPGDDWATNVIKAVFPIDGNGCNGNADNCTGNAATVIGQIIGQITGYVLALAMAYLCYTTIHNIHRVAESGNIFTDGMTSLFAVRLGFAGIMMFPLSSGFSTGQAAVVKASMWGIGMARAVYTNAVKAIGPDAMVLAQPVIPSLKDTVFNIMQNELCRSLVNQATGTQSVPAPTPTSSTSFFTRTKTITWEYALSAGNSWGTPACGSITLTASNGNTQTIAGVNTDMSAQQQQVLQTVILNDIRPAVESAADQYWATKKLTALTPLTNAFVTATNDYTRQITEAASQIRSQLQSAVTAQDARQGTIGLIQAEDKLSALGWTSAGAYYLAFARLNAITLSLASATPVINTPSFSGLPNAIKDDLAPSTRARQDF